MTLSDSTYRARGVKRQIPRQLGVIILLFDMLALLVAFATTTYVSQIFVIIAGAMGWGWEFHHFDTRRYYYYFLCLFVVLRFLMKGHYSRRVPWLAQIETIVQTVAFAAIFDTFNYYFIGEGWFPFMLLCNWALCIVLLVLGRYASHSIARRSENWKLPIALVGDARMVMDTMYAFDNDRHTGYEIQAVLLTGNDKIDPDFVPKSLTSIEIHQDKGSFDEFIKQNRQYYYIFGMDELRGPNKDMLTSAIDIAQIEYGLIPNTKSLDVYGMEPHYFFGNDIMILHRRDSIRPAGRDVGRGGAVFRPPHPVQPAAQPAGPTIKKPATRSVTRH
jgi:undecaprenyl-phosphate galactose phosphotransferase